MPKEQGDAGLTFSRHLAQRVQVGGPRLGYARDQSARLTARRKHHQLDSIRIIVPDQEEMLPHVARSNAPSQRQGIRSLTPKQDSDRGPSVPDRLDRFVSAGVRGSEA